MKFSLEESACAKNMFLNTTESLQEKVANQAITDILDIRDKNTFMYLFIYFYNQGDVERSIS